MPLAAKIRPKSFSDVYGQDHLCGEDGIFVRMCKSCNFASFVLFGRPGNGKTTIANLFKPYFTHSFNFNAATDGKAILKDIVTNYQLFFPVLLIVDEIHRLKKDTQDFLLPFTEDGSIILIGLTTENPYSALTPQLRSRLLIYELKPVSELNLIKYLEDVSKKEYNKVLDQEIYRFIASSSNRDFRSSLNILEVAFELKDLSVETLANAVGLKSTNLDQNGLNYYDLLSALIKSLRGSDVDAALYYTALFLAGGDLLMLRRRLLIFVYEDVGLANPNIGSQVKSALDSALDVGLPEARLMIGFVVVLLATSPKSNSAYKAINKAISFVETHPNYTIPDHILNRKIKGGSTYLYPHDYEHNFVKQAYLPTEIKDLTLFEFQNNKFENKFAEYYNKIREILKS